MYTPVHLISITQSVTGPYEASVIKIHRTVDEPERLENHQQNPGTTPAPSAQPTMNSNTTADYAILHELSLGDFFQPYHVN